MSKILNIYITSAHYGILRFSPPFCLSLKQSRLKHKATAKAHRFIAQTKGFCQQRTKNSPHLLFGVETRYNTMVF